RRPTRWTMDADRITLLVVDDDPLSRGALRRLVEIMAGVTVAGEASGPEEALRAARELRPDVVLMDIQLGSHCGLDLTRRLLAEGLARHILVVSVLPENPYAVEALRAGAAGFLHKEQVTLHLEEAIRTVARGQTYLSPAAALQLVQALARTRASAPGDIALTPREQMVLALGAGFVHSEPVTLPLDDATRTVPRGQTYLSPAPALHRVQALARTRASAPGDIALTPREQMVLALIAQGRSNKEIAATLPATVRTVKAHVSRILTKLNVEDRTQAAALALRLGLVPLGARPRPGPPSQDPIEPPEGRPP